MYAPLVTFTTLIWLLSQVCYSNATIPIKEKDQIVALQNSYRRKEKATNMNKLVWSDELANMAEKWVQKCVYGHGGLDDPEFVDVGQNLYITSSKTINYKSAIANWFDEKKNYDFDTQTCRSACGHYTQLVWADTILVGCAWNNCSSLKGSSFGKGSLLVCNYAGAGNYPDQDPYVKGEPCSGCSGSCEDKLCIAEY